MTFMVAFMTAFTVARCTIHHAIDFRRRDGIGKAGPSAVSLVAEGVGPEELGVLLAAETIYLA